MKNKYFLTLLFLLFAKPLFAQIGQFVGEIRLFAGNFAPNGWAFCEGQLIPLSQNTALFSLLGTTYGGDGRSNFALPDLRDRMAIGEGQGPGLSNYEHGQIEEKATLILEANNLPAHNHTTEIKISTAEGTTSVPASDKSLAAPNRNFNGVTLPAKGYVPTAGNVTLTTMTTSATGNSTPVKVTQPILPARYIIALQGIFPPRS
jgi:microcystin-dependent protein